MRLVLPFSLDKEKADSFTVAVFVLLIYVFDEGLQVGERFLGHGSILLWVEQFTFHCIIYLGTKPIMIKL